MQGIPKFDYFESSPAKWSESTKALLVLFHVSYCDSTQTKEARYRTPLSVPVLPAVWNGVNTQNSIDIYTR